MRCASQPPCQEGVHGYGLSQTRVIGIKCLYLIVAMRQAGILWVLACLALAACAGPSGGAGTRRVARARAQSGVAVAVHIDRGPGKPALYSPELSAKMAAAVRKARLFPSVVVLNQELGRDAGEINAEFKAFLSSPEAPSPLAGASPQTAGARRGGVGYLVDTHLSMSQVHSWLPKPLANALVEPYVRLSNQCMAESKTVVYDYRSQQILRMRGTAFPAAAQQGSGDAYGNAYGNPGCSPDALVQGIEEEAVEEVIGAVITDLERLIRKLM